MIFSYSAHCIAGNHSLQNQDSCGVFHSVFQGKGLLFAVVCDGMGGMQAGETASSYILFGLRSWFYELLPCIRQQPLTIEAFQICFDTHLRSLAKGLYERNQKNGIQAGTTLTAILIWDHFYFIVNIGDSRIYCIGDEMNQLTQDQSFVAQECARYAMTKEEAKHHPKRNYLLQCLGLSSEPEAVYCTGKVEKDRIFLLCSDGLVHEIWDAEMGSVLSPYRCSCQEDLEEAVKELINRALARGEEDNITAIAIRVDEDKKDDKSKQSFRQQLKKTNRNNGDTSVFLPIGEIFLPAVWEY